MKTKEKVERAGFVYKAMFGSLEVYVRGQYALMYSPEKDQVLAYSVWGDPQLRIIDDIQLEILLENGTEEMETKRC